MTIRKALIVYFSQSGANGRVGEAISSGLQERGYRVDTWNLKDGDPPDPLNYVLLGIGSPVYYYNVPVNVAHFLERLPSLSGIPAFVFLVHGTHRLDTANWVRRVLERKGACEVGYFHCRGESHVLALLREGYLFSPDRPSRSELAEAKAFGHLVADHMAGKHYARPPFEIKPPLIYRIERFLGNRWLIEHFYSRMFKVDLSKCIACGRCMKNCPTSNITQDALGRRQWHRRCLACLSCEMKCPAEAIRSALSRPVPGVLLRSVFRYNVRRWVREGELDYVRVVHRRGVTRRIGAMGNDQPA